MIGQRGVPATYGGIERHVEEIGERLVGLGHEVIVYCRPRYASITTDYYRGMALRHLPAPRSKHLEALVHSANATVDAMRQQVDIIHYHALGPGLIAPLPRLLSRAHVVQTVHALDQDRAKWGRAASTVLAVGENLSAWVPEATFVVSRALQQHYRTRYGKPTTYLCNGADLRAVEPGAGGTSLADAGLEGRQYVLFVGRLVPEKAPDLLIRAFRELPGDHLRLVLAGASSFTDSYVETLYALAAADHRVVMLGNVDRVALAEFYRAAAVFVLPSAVEGMPLTLLEAAAHGTPVLVSDIAPHREMIEVDGPGRRLFPGGNAAALTTTLSAMLANLPAEKAGAEGRLEMLHAEYDWDRAASQVADTYTSIVAADARLSKRPGRGTVAVDS